MKKYRDLTPEEWWEISDNLTPEDIMNGEVDHFLDDNYFWRQIEYEHPDLVSFLDNRYAIINKEYGLEKLHKLSKQHPRKKWEEIIAWYNHENNQKQNENKNMAKNKFRLTESKLKQIVAESVNKVLNETSYDSNGNFDAESHNSELRERLTQEVIDLRKYLDEKLNSLNYIAMHATDDRIKTRARAIMGEIMSSTEEADRAYQLIKANRWDID